MQHKRIDQLQRCMFSRTLLWASMLMIVLLVSGCKKDPRVEFIQGVWYYKDPHLANLPGESAQVTNWEFDNYYFAIDSCCFTKEYFSGNYSISERDENKLILELYNMQGQMGGSAINKDNTMTIIITLDPETDTIKVSGAGPYARVGPKSP